MRIWEFVGLADESVDEGSLAAVHLTDQSDVTYECRCLHETEKERLLEVHNRCVRFNKVELLLLDGLYDGLLNRHRVLVLHHGFDILTVNLLRLWVVPTQKLTTIAKRQKKKCTFCPRAALLRSR